MEGVASLSTLQQEKGMKKYTSPITAGLTPDNWQEKVRPKDLSLDDCVDLYADFKEMEKFSKKMAGYLKEVITGKMPEGETEFEGSHFAIVFNYRERAGNLDKDMITEVMGEEWVLAYLKPSTEFTELRYNAIDPDEVA